MERYESMPAGTMPPALALGTFLDFARTALLQKELWVLPDELAGQLRLLGQRCTLATPGVGAGSMNAAQESILREHLLKLVWQFPKLEKLLAGVLSSQEAHAFEMPAVPTGKIICTRAGANRAHLLPETQGKILAPSVACPARNNPRSQPAPPHASQVRTAPHLESSKQGNLLATQPYVYV